MWLKKLSEIKAFVAGDETLLKEVLNPNDKDSNVRYSLAHAVVKPRQTTLPHQLKSSETYYMLSGIGEVNIDGEKQVVEPGDTIHIPPMATQSIKNIGDEDLAFLCICDPAWRKIDEIVK